MHQFLIGLFGKHIIPASMYEYTKTLHRPDLVTRSKSGKETFLISSKMLEDVWKRLRDRLASVKSSTSMIEISTDYAAHFFDMYVQNHEGKHMTGDRMKILLLNLPFVLRDLITPEVSDDYLFTYNIACDITCDITCDIPCDILYDIIYDIYCCL